MGILTTLHNPFIKNAKKKKRTILIKSKAKIVLIHLSKNYKPLIYLTGTSPGLKADLDDGGGTSDSRLSEQEEEAIAMSMVPTSWQHQARSPADGKLLAHASNTAIKPSPGHHSLPRKKTSESRNSSTQQFQRAQSLRRSCLSPTQYHHHHQHRQQESSLHFEYFVPRSVSEFNLAAAAVTDMAVPPPPPTSVLRPSSAVTPPVPSASNSASANQSRLLECTGTATRSREKMVTFEDESVSCATSTPTRKNVSGLENVFMWRCNHGWFCEGKFEFKWMKEYWCNVLCFGYIEKTINKVLI